MNPVRIQGCRASLWPDLFDYIVAMNAQDEHRIGYLGTDAPSILDDLSEIPDPVHQAFLVALDEQTGTVVGALGIESDLTVGRAWLHGPFVDRPSHGWDAVADSLYARAVEVIPSEISEHELCIGVHNHRVERFGERHGFATFSHSIGLSIRRDDLPLRAEPSEEVCPIAPPQHEGFVALHEKLFPKTYYTGRQILERISDHTQVFVVQRDAHLVGYLFVRLSPEVGTGYVEFVGVDVASRNRGIGSKLVSRGLAWAFHHPGLDEIALTVSASNQAALAFYEKHGFQRGEEILGLRLVCAPDLHSPS